MSKDKTKYTNWTDLEWRKLEKTVWKLQRANISSQAKGKRQAGKTASETFGQQLCRKITCSEKSNSR